MTNPDETLPVEQPLSYPSGNPDERAIYAEARRRMMRDATGEEYDFHLVRVAFEAGRRAAQSPPPVSERNEALQARLRNAANNIEYTRNKASLGGLAGWEHQVCREAADLIERLSSPPSGCDAETIEACANIALAIDSGRGNEKLIAAAIRNLGKEQQP